jgi:hypothetical protein
MCGTLGNSIINSKKKILIQGDSWIELLVYYKNIKEKICTYANNNNYIIILGGISSFSPSLYEVQIDILKRDFNFIPDKVITFIDHTDFGDENCRYKDFRKIKNNKIIVENFQSFRNGIFYQPKSILNRTKILSNNNFYLIKMLKLSFLKMQEYYFFKIKSKINQGCTFDIIQSKLINNANLKEIDYFNMTLKSYVENIKKKQIKDIYFLSHPHRQHITKIYKKKIFDYIDKSKNIFQSINFIELKPDLENFYLNDIYVKGDPGSHLKESYIEKIFLKQLILIISNSKTHKDK